MKKIPLSKTGKNKGKYFAMVDNDVFDIVNEYDWCYKQGYAINSKMGMLLHRYIWTLKVGDIPAELEVEHKNQDKLDCRLENLRLATSSENHCNITIQKNNKSGHKGISREVYKGHPRKDGTYKIYTRWKAIITKDYRKKTKKVYSKRFPYTDEGLKEAIEWYKQKSLELHKEFSIYNKPKK